ncbi:LysR family transcriptional regulator [Lactobacillus sp. ESL0677]|uniref:LysR family transcriptional regulator n=1 Tax=Lactobacillus sp. ESL0677 TaxID=2983208 RepID=UPI0023F969B4|nr:LysR family transcriptional regulator [Lactobacillus sp. ESL0677]WEV36930.1 LysR family transcriptional regulator [Lactobacillus sp. ESL0677]
MDSLNVKDLMYFLTILEKRSFSQAAKDCGVSQPTLTLAIKRLENDFQTSLLVRDHSHQQLRPTPTGQQLAPHARSILAELDLTKREIAQIERQVIRLGLPPIIGNYYFPQIFPELFKAGLTNSLETIEAGSSHLQELLESGDLEMALLGSIAPTFNDQLHVNLFAKTEFKVVVAPEHPLAKQKSVSFTDLKKQPFITLSNVFVHEQAFKQLCKRAQIKPRIIYKANDIQILKAMVRQNLGIGFLTQTALSKTDQLCTVNLTDPKQPHFYMSVAYRKTHRLTSDEQQLLAILRQNLCS